MRHTDMQLNDCQIVGNDGQRIRRKSIEHDESKR